jgi:alpha-beta hydrolase superfamily lysophospholipase
VIRWFEHRQVYAPSRKHEARAADLQRPFEEVFFNASDGVRLHGWFFPADKQSPRRHITLLLMHGNAGNISHRLHFFEAWLGLGVNVFAFDYRGFGRSEGKAGEEGTYRDAQAAMAWLRGRGFAGENVIALGKSLGGGIASELALRERIGALVLQSTFTSIPDIGAELFSWLPVRRLHSIAYDTVNKLPRVTVPVLVVHSRTDNLIGFHHAEKNYKVTLAPKMFLETGGNHTNVLEVDRERYLAGLDSFFQRHFKPS